MFSQNELEAQNFGESYQVRTDVEVSLPEPQSGAYPLGQRLHIWGWEWATIPPPSAYRADALPKMSYPSESFGPTSTALGLATIVPFRDDLEPPVGRAPTPSELPIRCSSIRATTA